MDSPTDIMEQLYLSHPHNNARGWINVNCPLCADKRLRSGFKRTDNGGFTLSCWNSGCELSTSPTGWQPGYIFGGMTRRVFECLGGNINDIDIKDRIQSNRLDNQGKIKDEYKVTTSFDKISLPPNSIYLIEAVDKYPNAKKVLNYLNSRGEFFKDIYPFYYCKSLPYYLIVPYYYKGDIVGYMGRNISVNGGDNRFIQKSHSDFLFNQDQLYDTNKKTILVCESPIDAIALNGIATRSSHLNKRQINLLRTSNKKIILIPDQKLKEFDSYFNAARDNGFYVSVPTWGGDCKDTGEAIKKYGLYYTMKLIMDNASNNYISISAKLRLNSR